MSENTEKFHNLAEKMGSSAPSRLQMIKEYFASLFGVQQIDKNFLRILQDVSDKVSETLSQNSTEK